LRVGRIECQIAIDYQGIRFSRVDTVIVIPSGEGSVAENDADLVCHRIEIHLHTGAWPGCSQSKSGSLRGQCTRRKIDGVKLSIRRIGADRPKLSRRRTEVDAPNALSGLNARERPDGRQ